MIKFGIIANTHGIKGHVKILSNSDFKELRLKKGAMLRLKDKFNTEEFDVVVSSWQEHKGFDLVKLKGFDNINQSEKLKNFNVFVPELTNEDVEEDEFLYDDLKGCTVIDNKGIEHGKVTNVVNYGADDCLEIKTSDGIKLIPFIDVFVETVDIENSKIIVNAIEGLL